MPNYKVVNADQLDADLTTVSNAIKAKAGTADPLVFPEGFVSAIEACGTGAVIEPLDHTVTFKDDQSTVMAVYTVREGVGNIYAPSGITAKKWVDEDGNVVSFPVNPTTDIIIVANNEASASEALYAFYEIDQSVYPILVISNRGEFLVFGKNTNGQHVYNGYFGYGNVSYDKNGAINHYLTNKATLKRASSNSNPIIALSSDKENWTNSSTIIERGFASNIDS